MTSAALVVNEESVARLYYAAKNLAVELALRKLEAWLSERGVKGATASWEEGSRSAFLVLEVRRGRAAPLRTSLHLERTQLAPSLRPSGLPNLDHHIGGIWGCSGRSAAAATLNKALASDEGVVFVRTLVEGCNYPFVRGFYSTVG